MNDSQLLEKKNDFVVDEDSNEIKDTSNLLLQSNVNIESFCDIDEVANETDKIKEDKQVLKITNGHRKKKNRKLRGIYPTKNPSICTSIRRRWRYTIRLLTRFSWMILYITLISFTIHRARKIVSTTLDKHEIAWTIGGTFVVATVPISTYQIYQHLAHFVSPLQQTHVIRMISMVPIYAIQSWFSLRYPVLSLYTLNIREVYEAYVVYSFVNFLINYMQSKDPHYIKKLASKPAYLGKHMYPFCCFSDWKMGIEFLSNCKHGVLQYLGVRLCTLILTLLLENFALYDEGSYSIYRGFFWLTLVNCCSQTWALYVLILFYHATQNELTAINPCVKFLSIKAVVFASWWQSLLIGLMVHRGTIGELDSHSAEMVAKAVQDLLICTEMLMASIAFSFAFPLSDFVTINYAEGAYSYSGKYQDRKSAQRDKKQLAKPSSDLGVNSIHDNTFQNQHKNNTIVGDSVVHLRAKVNSNTLGQGNPVRTSDKWYNETIEGGGNDIDSVSISLSTLDDSLNDDLDTTIENGASIDNETGNIKRNLMDRDMIAKVDAEGERREEDDIDNNSDFSKFDKIKRQRYSRQPTEPDYDSFWHALWISCIPSDVREELRLATLEFFRNMYNHYAYSSITNEQNNVNDTVVDEIEVYESDNEDFAERIEKDDEELKQKESNSQSSFAQNTSNIWRNIASQWTLLKRRAVDNFIRRRNFDIHIKSAKGKHDETSVELKPPYKYSMNSSYKRTISVDTSNQTPLYKNSSPPTSSKQSLPRSAIKKTKSEIDLEA